MSSWDLAALKAFSVASLRTASFHSRLRVRNREKSPVGVLDLKEDDPRSSCDRCRKRRFISPSKDETERIEPW